MRRFANLLLLAGSLGLSLALVTPALAHVVVKPARVPAASEQLFTVSVPNESDKGVAMTALRLLLPAGFSDVTPTAISGWRVTVKKEGDTPTEIDWDGGSIPAGQREDFSFSAQAPATEQTVAWKAYQGFQDGSQAAWDQQPGTGTNNPYSQTDVYSGTSAVDRRSFSTQSAAFVLSLAALIISLVSLLYRRK